MKLSVVISAFNEEKKIADCLESVKDIADEIIFIDNTSEDKTVSIAKKFTDKVFIRKNNLMLNVNKNFGFEKATGDWILSLDADERLTPELREEIKKIIDEKTHVDGFYIPRKNIIFGKWIEHTGWYPDPQLRLFKKEKGKFEEKHVHEMLIVSGKTATLENPMIHENYETITQFLQKMILIYTPSEAESLIRNGYRFQFSDILAMPVKEFFQRYYAQEGYKDGFHGLVLSFLMGFYHFVVFLRLWEMNKFNQISTEELEITLKPEIEKIEKEFKYWSLTKVISRTDSFSKKTLLKIRRKGLKV